VHSQDTSAQLRAREIGIVRELASLDASRRVEFDDEGWDSRVYVVDGGDAVFKFPRSPAVRARYADEVRVLQALEPLELPVQIPLVRWVGPDLEYFGYEGMRGSAPTLGELSPESRRAVGRALGAFARVLHGLDLPTGRTLTVEDEIADFQAKYAAAGLIVAEHFTAAERRRLDAFYGERLPEELRALGTEPRSCHGDLGPWNVILDEAGGVGVIDFGDVVRCDRSKDFIGLDDDVTLDAAISAYGDAPRLRERIAVRAAALPAMDLVFFAGKRDARRLAICIDRIRRLHP
jgi:aminoglycoside phosphotransferase (APT) family kinase protein